MTSRAIISICTSKSLHATGLLPIAMCNYSCRYTFYCFHCKIYCLYYVQTVLSSVDFLNFLELPDEKMEFQDPEGGIQEPAQSSVYL